MFEIDHADVGGTGIGHISALAIFGHVDEVRPAVHADRGYNGVAFGVDHADVVRSRVDGVDFVLLAVGGDAGGLAADPNRLGQSEGAQIDHADRVALPVGDVGKLAESGSVTGELLLAEVPPGDSAEDGQQDGDEEELAQSGVGTRETSKISRTRARGQSGSQ
jgi:hypothetical protein